MGFYLIPGNMFIIPINFANFNLVIVKDGTPHCIKHGAMNKITKNKDNGGYWRCLGPISNQNDTLCRAGCCQKII